MGRFSTALVLAFLLLTTSSTAVEPIQQPRWVGIFPLKDRIGLKWIDVPKADHYLVQRKKGGERAWASVADVKVSSWVDQEVVVGIYYYYRVIAVAADGRKSDPSEDRYTRLQQPGKEAVGEPEWVGVLIRPGGVGLKWAPGDGALPIVYNVYRKRTGEETFSLIGSSDKPGYLDDRVTVGETYVYQVKAIGADFVEGPGSVERRVYFLPAVPTPDMLVRPFPAERRPLQSTAGMDFRSPTDAALDYRGLLYVSDTFHNRVAVLDPAKGWVRDIGAPVLQRPLGIGVSTDGSLAVVEGTTATVRIYDRDGKFTRSIDCGKFAQGGECGLIDVAWDPGSGGGLAIVDNLGARIFLVAKDGTLRAVAGERGSSRGRLLAPGMAAYGPKGDLFVVDQLRSMVLVYGSDGVFRYEFGGRGRSYGSFGRPKGIAFDAAGRCYIADGLVGSVQIFLATGEIIGYLTDAEEEPIDTTAPAGMAVGRSGEVYLVEKLLDRLARFVITDTSKLEQAGRDAALRSTGKIAPVGAPSPITIAPTPTPTPAARPLLPVRPIGPIPLPTGLTP